MKSVRIRCFSGPYFPTFGLNIIHCESVLSVSLLSLSSLLWSLSSSLWPLSSKQIFKSTLNTPEQHPWHRRSKNLYCQLWADFTPCSVAFTVGIEQINGHYFMICKQLKNFSMRGEKITSVQKEGPCRFLSKTCACWANLVAVTVLK